MPKQVGSVRRAILPQNTRGIKNVLLDLRVRILSDDMSAWSSASESCVTLRFIQQIGFDGCLRRRMPGTARADLQWRELWALCP